MRLTLRPGGLAAPTATACRALGRPRLRAAQTARAFGAGRGADIRGPLDEDDAEDPVKAMLWAAQSQGGTMRVIFDEEDDQEQLEDALDDLEDAWMRHPTPPEWAEAPGLALGMQQQQQHPGTADEYRLGAGGGVDVMTWAELEALLVHEQAALGVGQSAPLEDGHAGSMVVVCVVEEEPRNGYPAPRLLLPEPPPWGIREVTDTDSSRGGAVCRVVVERLPLTAVTRDAADAWRDAAAVAVLDSGHHSALAAAVRLSAVYRLRRVCLLTLDASTLL